MFVLKTVVPVMNFYPLNFYGLVSFKDKNVEHKKCSARQPSHCIHATTADQKVQNRLLLR